MNKLFGKDVKGNGNGSNRGICLAELRKVKESSAKNFPVKAKRRHLDNMVGSLTLFIYYLWFI